MITGEGSQLSAAVGALNDGTAGHSIVASAPWPDNTGAVLSSTVIVWLTGADTLPQASLAIHVLVIRYDPVHEPGNVVSVKVITGAGSQLSVADGALNDGTAGHSIVASAPWPDNMGAVLSSTVIVCFTGADILPQASLAVHVLVIRYDPAHAPGTVVSL